MIPCPTCAKLVPNDTRRCSFCGFSLVATTRFVKKAADGAPAPYAPPAEGVAILPDAPTAKPLFDPETLAMVIALGSIALGLLLAYGARNGLTLINILLIGALVGGGLGMLRQARWGLMAARVGTLFAILALVALLWFMGTLARGAPESMVAATLLILAFEVFAFYHMVFNRGLRDLYE